MRWSVTGQVELIVYEEQSYTKTSLGDAQESGKSEQKILGLQWNFVEDNLVFELGTVARLASECRPTKSNIAAVAAKFYEPIGFITPVQFISPVQFSSVHITSSVQFKLLFQDLCSSGADWNDTLEGQLRVKWDKLVERCYFKEPRNEIVCCNLHAFCDASLKAYGAVVYLQVQLLAPI